MGCGLQVSAEVLNGKVPTLGQTGLEEALPQLWEFVAVARTRSRALEKVPDFLKSGHV